MGPSILSYLRLAASGALVQILILLGPGLLLAFILNFETAFVQRRSVSVLGRGWYLGLFGWLGTIVHELGHAVFCVLFGHKITDIKLFKPDPETGTLGYVKHSYNRTNIYHLVGNFFIGIGPILLGAAVIFFLALWLLGINSMGPGGNLSALSESNLWGSLKDFVQGLWLSSSHLLVEMFSWRHVLSWQLYVFIYLVFAIGSSITLSPPDIKSAAGGFAAIVILVLVLNLATAWAGNFVTDFAFKIAGSYVFFYTLIFLVFLINLAVVLLALLPLSLLKTKASGSKA